MSLSVKGISCSTLHFVGIFGSGMSAIAQYCTWAGLTVTGSDRLLASESTRTIGDTLVSIGCGIHAQDGSGITEKTDALVVSTAIEDSNPDMSRARELNIPVFHRSDVLAAIVRSKKTIAVAGTSGKSTVAALIFHLLRTCGAQPSLITGANLNELVEKGMIGNACHDTSDLLVIEADESDGTLVKYEAFCSLFLNLSKDHKPVEETLPLFQTLAGQSKHVFVNNDDAHLKSMRRGDAVYTFGETGEADYAAEKMAVSGGSAAVTLAGKTFTVPFPGNYMAKNLLASLAVCTFLGCKDTDLQRASGAYRGIQRRFDRYETGKNITVIDDYAHNPEKLKAAIETVQSLSHRVIALFQPHGFGPTKFLFKELVEVFETVMRSEDTLILLPIYYAGGTADKTIASSDVAGALTSCKAAVYTPEKRDDAVATILARVKPGDIVLSMGARDPSLSLFAKKIAEAVDKGID